MLNSNQFLYTRDNKNLRHRPVAKSALKAWHKSFQWKYTAFLIAAVFGTVALFLSVAFYKIHQNYDIFQQLAFDTNPALVEHLDREVSEFGIFVITTLIAVLTFCVLLGFRFTSNIIRPMIHLERHMKKVTEGNWSSHDFRFRPDEDLSELMDTYSYMYRSLRAHTENEIKMLEKITIDPNNRESLSLWSTLIQQKKLQLYSIDKRRSNALSAEETSQSPAFPRAS